MTSKTLGKTLSVHKRSDGEHYEELVEEPQQMKSEDLFDRGRKVESIGGDGEVRGVYNEYYYLSEWQLEDPGLGDGISHLLEDGRVSLYEYLEYYDEGDC